MMALKRSFSSSSRSQVTQIARSLPCALLNWLHTQCLAFKVHVVMLFIACTHAVCLLNLPILSSQLSCSCQANKALQGSPACLNSMSSLSPAVSTCMHLAATSWSALPQPFENTQPCHDSASRSHGRSVSKQAALSVCSLPTVPIDCWTA